MQRKSASNKQPESYLVSYFQSPAFASLVKAVVRNQTQALCQKIRDLHKQLEVFRKFNFQVVKILCDQNSEDLYNLGRSAHVTHEQYNTNLLQEDEEEIDFNFYDKLMNACIEMHKPKEIRIRKSIAVKPKTKIIPIPELNRFLLDCLNKVGIEEEKANIMSRSIIKAEFRGLVEEGISRFEVYIDEIKNKMCSPGADPTIISETESTAWVDGNHTLGCVVGMFCVKLAILKASQTGIALVVANINIGHWFFITLKYYFYLDSNNFGCNSFFTEYAATKGFIGMAFTNSHPLMVPTGAKEVGFGYNCMALAAPVENCERVVIDFASTAVTLQEIIAHKEKNLPIPLGWALDENGEPTTDPEVAIRAKKLTPLGGSESYKGTGLAFLVEVMSSLLADASFGPNIQSTDRKLNMGHGFMVVDPRKFVPGFEKRINELNNIIRKLESTDPLNPIHVPGDRERIKKKKISQQGGIEFGERHCKTILKLVELLDVKPPRAKW